MTTGPDHPQASNHHAMHPRDDRETLSALFDGELQADARRFALKRLDHDAGWREACGRWQLIGDALRGEVTAAAPSYFAAGVMRALASDQAAHVAAPAGSPAGGAAYMQASRWPWIGGAALAASVAMAAMLVVRPFSQQAPAASGASIAAGPASTSSRSPTVVPETIAPAIEAASASTTRLAEATPRQGGGSLATQTNAALRRPSRAMAPAIELPVDEPPANEPAANEPATAVAAAIPETAHRPFHPPADTITTRPWPRAVLPGAPAAGGFTVGLGSNTAPSPSFYPFEPRLPTGHADQLPPEPPPQQ